MFSHGLDQLISDWESNLHLFVWNWLQFPSPEGFEFGNNVDAVDSIVCREYVMSRKWHNYMINKTS